MTFYPGQRVIGLGQQDSADITGKMGTVVGRAPLGTYLIEFDEPKFYYHNGMSLHPNLSTKDKHGWYVLPSKIALVKSTFTEKSLEEIL